MYMIQYVGESFLQNMMETHSEAAYARPVVLSPWKSFKQVEDVEKKIKTFYSVR